MNRNSTEYYSSKSKLLLSVAASALFCLGTVPAYADCSSSYDGTTKVTTVSCSGTVTPIYGWSSLDEIKATVAKNSDLAGLFLETTPRFRSQTAMGLSFHTSTRTATTP